MRGIRRTRDGPASPAAVAPAPDGFDEHAPLSPSSPVVFEDDEGSLASSLDDASLAVGRDDASLARGRGGFDDAGSLASDRTGSNTSRSASPRPFRASPRPGRGSPRPYADDSSLAASSLAEGSFEDDSLQPYLDDDSQISMPPLGYDSLDDDGSVHVEDVEDFDDDFNPGRTRL